MFEFVSLETWMNYKSKNEQIITSKTNYPTQLPARSTYKSAGYDFFSPMDLVIDPGKIYCFPTGIKWNPGKDLVNTFLALYPRSSLGFNYGFSLCNTVGIIDEDYYNNPANEGHIIVAFITTEPMSINKGDRLVQGIIQPYLNFIDELIPTKLRSGGIGSTGK